MGFGSPWARIYVEITSAQISKIPIAVPLFTGSRPLALELSRVMARDLFLHGYFEILGENTEIVDREAWKGLGVDYLILGRVYQQVEKVRLELRAFDLTANEMILGRAYTGRVSEARYMVHRYTYQLVKAITGEEGIALSRIFMVIKRGAIKEAFSIDFDGFNLLQETFDAGTIVSPRLSPNGRYLVYTSYKKGRPWLYIKDFNTGKVRVLSSRAGLNIAPAWHPRGDRLVATLSFQGNPDLYLLDLNGRILRRLTAGPGANVSATFSPDGRQIAFVSDRSGSPQIYILDLETNKIRRLTYEGSYNTSPAWSPRGDRLAYAGLVSGQFQIFTIDPRGGDPVMVTDTGSNETPVWSPDGRQIAFVSNRSGRRSLWVIMANGSSPRILFSSTGDIYDPFWSGNIY
ncbi:protein TolB [Thermosulfuriphilus sp.]